MLHVCRHEQKLRSPKEFEKDDNDIDDFSGRVEKELNTHAFQSKNVILHALTSWVWQLKE